MGFLQEVVRIQVKLLKQNHVKARSCTLGELHMRSQTHV